MQRETRTPTRVRPRSGRRVPLAILAGSLWLAACGVTDTAPSDVALADLVLEQDRYDGQMVRTHGVVRTFDEPRHYWIEDDDVNRVEVVPQDAIRPYLGDEVEVVGRFTFRDDEGRRITAKEIDDITAVE